MGTTVEQAGQKSARSLQDFHAKAAAFGAAVGAATGLMANFARAAAEDEASQARVEQAITNTGASLDDYSAKLEASIKAGQRKAFSDDQTRDALVALNLVTNDTGASISELGLTMDFARAKGIDLSTAASVIGKVYGGNLGILTRYGIVLDQNTTSEEALAEIQKRVAGQAQTYADTSIGKAEILKDRISETTEAWGKHAGAMQEVLLLMPGLTAAYTALGAAIGGVGGAASLASGALKLAGPAALIGGAGLLAYGYSQDTLGTTQVNTLANEFFLSMSNVLNQLLPGSPYNTGKYTGQMATNAQWDTINSILQTPGTSQDATVQSLAKLLGVPGSYRTVDTGYWVDANGNTNYGSPPPGVSTSTQQYIPPSNEEILKAATQGAALVGLSLADYLKGQAAQAGWITDPVSGTAMPIATYQRYSSQRGLAYGTQAGLGYGGTFTSPGVPTPRYYGDTSQTGYIGPYQPNTSTTGYGAPSPRYAGDPGYRTGGDPFGTTGADTATGGGMALGGTELATSAAAAIKVQADAYYGLATQSQVAKTALSEFKQVQDSLIQSEGVYGQQISEFSSQVSAEDAAYGILNQRKEDGIALTKQQTDFLNNYAEANKRGTGAVEDATIAQGMLAQQYLLNMEKGDQLNQTLGENADSIGQLVDVIQDLILSMDGVPEDVKTRIELERAEESISSLQTLVYWLNQVGDRSATIYVNEQHTGISIGSPGGVGPTVGLGGVINYGRGGVVAQLAEWGPEYVSLANGGGAWANQLGFYSLSRGDYVHTAPASVGKGSGGGHTFNGPVYLTVVANDPQQLWDGIRESATGGSR